MTIAPLFVNSCIQTYDSMERTATKDQNQRRFRKLDLTKLLHSYSLETLRNQVKEYLCKATVSYVSIVICAYFILQFMNMLE